MLDIALRNVKATLWIRKQTKKYRDRFALNQQTEEEAWDVLYVE